MHWDAWLRSRRDDPPSAEEVARVQERVERGKAMSAQAMQGESVKDELTTSDAKVPFPKYDDLDSHPIKRKPD